MAAKYHSTHLVAEVLSAYCYSFKFRNFRFVSYKLSDTVTAQYRSSAVMLKYWTESKDSLAKYSRIYSTKSPASGASSVSEPRLMSQVGRVREVVRACVYVIRAVEAQYSSADVVAEVI